MVTKTRKNEITVQNQETCAQWYAWARECYAAGNFKDALYWQNSAAGHFPKLAYRMGIADLLWPDNWRLELPAPIIQKTA